jgi:hypothetical protein
MLGQAGASTLCHRTHFLVDQLDMGYLVDELPRLEISAESNPSTSNFIGPSRGSRRQGTGGKSTFWPETKRSSVLTAWFWVNRDIFLSSSRILATADGYRPFAAIALTEQVVKIPLDNAQVSGSRSRSPYSSAFSDMVRVQQSANRKLVLRHHPINPSKLFFFLLFTVNHNIHAEFQQNEVFESFNSECFATNIFLFRASGH